MQHLPASATSRGYVEEDEVPNNERQSRSKRYPDVKLDDACGSMSEVSTAPPPFSDMDDMDCDWLGQMSPDQAHWI